MRVSRGAVLLSVCLAAFLLAGCASREEKAAYQKAVQEDTIESYKGYLAKFPRGHYLKKARAALAGKIFAAGTLTRSYRALDAFQQQYAETDAATLARELLRTYKAQFEANAALKTAVAGIGQAARAGRLEEALAVAESLPETYPDLDGKLDFVGAQVGEGLSACLEEVRRLDETAPPAEKMARVALFERLAAAALRFRRFELGKAALLRAFLEAYPYYYSSRDVQVMNIMAGISAEFGPKPFMLLSAGVDDELTELFQRIDRHQFVGELLGALQRQSADQLKERTAAARDVSQAEGELVKTVFETAIKRKVGTDALKSILGTFGHPVALTQVVEGTTDYIDYGIANLTTAVGEALRPGLLLLLDERKLPVRVNAIVALAWLEADPATVKKLKALSLAAPKTDEERVQNLAIDFALEHMGETKSIDTLLSAALASEYRVAVPAISLLRYTNAKVPAAKAIAICAHAAPDKLKDPKAAGDNNLVVAAVQSNRIFGTLGGLVANSEYSDEIGKLIFLHASRAYDGGQGDAIREAWREAADAHAAALGKLAEQQLASDDLMKARLAVRLLLKDKEGDALKPVGEKIRVEVLPAWQKRKAFFRPFVEQEVKAELAEREKTTFYPYYIPYDSIYSRLTEGYFNEAYEEVRTQLALKQGLPAGERLASLEKGDRPRLMVALSLSDPEPSFLARVQGLFARSKPATRLACAAILAGHGDAKGFEHLLARSGDVAEGKEAAYYLANLDLSAERVKQIRDFLAARRPAFAELPARDKKNEEADQTRERIGKAFVPVFCQYARLSHVLAREAASSGMTAMLAVAEPKKK